MKYIKGLISIIIPTYKRAEKVERAIESVLNQTYTYLELIVVNDNDVDDIYTIDLKNRLEKYANDKRFKFVMQDKHKNGAAARNFGIRMSKGEYIAFLDDDDYWRLNKLELQVKELSELDNTWGAVSCLMNIYLKNRLIMSTLPYKSGNIMMEVLCRKISIGTGSVLIRRTALDSIGYFDEKLLRHQDLQLFANLTEKYKVKLVKKYLHNREIEDAQNRPSVMKLNEIKDSYFSSIRDVIDRLDPKSRDKMFIMHNFECSYAYYKEGLFRECFVMLKRIFCYSDTVYWALDRVFRRLIEKFLKSYLQKLYK